MKTVNLKTSGYFPGTIQFLGVILLLAVAVVAFKSIIASLILALSSLVIFTTHYRLTVDYTNKVYHDYLWILGFKTGDKGKFENIEYVFIKKITVTQKMNLQSLSSTVKKEVYDGYLKFSEKDKIHLMTRDSKKDLIEKLRAISRLLNVRIMDFSEQAPKEV